MSEHSSGPWRYRKNFEAGAFGLPRDAWGIYRGPETDEEDTVGRVYGEDNARLIAAAPTTKAERDELLRSLKRMLVLIVANHAKQCDCVRCESARLIARIEGNQPLCGPEHQPRAGESYSNNLPADDEGKPTMFDGTYTHLVDGRAVNDKDDTDPYRVVDDHGRTVLLHECARCGLIRPASEATCPRCEATGKRSLTVRSAK